jgi:hypothetical protein
MQKDFDDLRNHFNLILQLKDTEISRLKEKVASLEYQNSSKRDLKNSYLKHSSTLFDVIEDRLRNDDFSTEYTPIRIPITPFSTIYNVDKEEKRRVHLKRLKNVTEDLITMLQNRDVTQVRKVTPLETTTKIVDDLILKIEAQTPKRTSKALDAINNLLLELNTLE